MDVPFTNGFYQSSSIAISNQQCVNWFPNQAQAGGVSPEQLLGIEGIESKGSTGGKTRGSIKFKGDLYRVDGNQLYRIDSNYTTTALGFVSGGGRVSMAENGDTIAIIDPTGNGYFYDTADGLNQINDTVFIEYNQVKGVAYLNGYFVYFTETVLFSGSPRTVNQGQDFNALDFVEAESFTDNIVGLIASIGQFYVLGEQSTEVFRISATSTAFPFARAGASVIERGLFSQFLVTEAQSAVWMIGGDSDETRAVFMLQGAQHQKVSTDGIDYILNTISKADFDKGFSWSYGNNGHYFIGWTFPSTSIVFDTTTKRWHERQSNGLGWSPQTIDKINSDLLVGGLSGEIGRLSADIYTEYGATIHDRISTQPFRGQGAFAIQQMELTCQAGVGNADSANPTIQIRTSRDNGVMWTQSLARDLGAIGERQKRQIWRNLGRFDDTVVLEVSVNEPVQKMIGIMSVDFI
jgi:hypothetical protein